MRIKRRWVATGLGLAALACSMGMIVPMALQQHTPVPGEIVVDIAGIRPEGVEWDAARQRFIIGSLADGTLRAVSPEGVTSTLIDDPQINVSVGLEIDAASNRLLVTSSEATAFFNPFGRGGAGLAAYDLDSMERLFVVDLGGLSSEGRHFANDVAVDAEGNAYVTDSFSPILYRVTPQGEASIFLRDPALGAGFLGLNGIAFHPDGFLLVANSGTRSLLRVPLDAPEQVQAVATDVAVGIDGMALAEGGTLYIVNNAGEQSIDALVSDDGWTSARLVGRALTQDGATTLTVRDGQPWYINAYLMNFLARQYQIVPADVQASRG
jgi:sugar lactone lactonase YvrE